MDSAAAILHSIRTELMELGMPFNAATNLMRYSLPRYETQLADLHNTGQITTANVMDAPGEDLIDTLDGADMGAAGIICINLVGWARHVSHGNCNPEVTLPMRYAAELVHRARRHVARHAAAV